MKQNVALSNEVNYIRAEWWKSVHDCGKAYSFKRLSLDYEGFENDRFTKNTVIEVVRWLKSAAADADLDAYVQKRFSAYDPAWFDSKPEYEANMERDMNRVLRIGYYIRENGYQVVDVYVPYHCAFEKPIKYRGVSVGGIKGNYSFVLTRDGEEERVILMSGAPSYSSKARKKENLPENSLELMAAWVAGKSMSPDRPVHVALWHMKNKDDKGMTMPVYESRPGKNIVRADFETTGMNGTVKRFFEGLVTCEKADCDNCIHKQVCQMCKEARVPKLKEKESKKDKGNHQMTEAQKKVVEHVNGPMCVIAVPGAGKTTSLVERLVSLCEKGVKPRTILFLTFTKKAAKEIEERVSMRLAKQGIKGMPVISTYNSFGFTILKENPTYLGRRVRLADSVDKLRMISKALAETPRIKDMSYAGMTSEYGLVHQMLSFIEEIEESGEDAFVEKYAQRKDTDGLLAVYHAYQNAYEKGGYISYDDQIAITNQLFEEYPSLARKCAKKYEYVMVDEFQDSSEEQVDMVYAVAQHGNIVVVGDDDQELYKWRGGSSQYMLQFKKDFPNAEMVFMEDNFRSNAGILTAANALIQGNGKRYEKRLKGHVTGDSKPTYVKSMDQSYLPKIIKMALEHGTAPGDIAVLARTGKRLEEAQKILEGIVKCAVPKDYLVEDSVFLAIFDVLNLFFHGMDTDVSLYRVFGYLGMEEGLHKTSRGSLYQNLVKQGVLDEMKLTAECMESFESHANESDGMAVGYKLLKCFEKAKYSDVHTVMESILEEIFGLSDHVVVNSLCDLADTKGIVHLKNVFEMMETMMKFHTDERVGYESSTDAVNLLTCHDSKGKEFSTVIVYGAEDFGESEEEIRVLYVSMTRAMRNLFLIETSYNQHMEVFEKIRPYVRVIGQE